MKIVLLGFMGSGKSTIGRLLSERLEVPFLDLDEEIIRKTELSIPEIFSSLGEEKFREIEREVLTGLLSKPGSLVISTGGGVPAYKDNMELINKNSISIYLKADFEKLWERISKDGNRPLVAAGKEKVRKLFERRIPFYERADIVVRTDSQTPEETIDEILKKLNSFPDFLKVY